MKLAKLGGVFFSALTASALSACGFKPIYAVSEESAAPITQKISIGAVNAPQEIYPYVNTALTDRLAVRDDLSPEYELSVGVRETAERLAVQIDATVTRYNYRLSASYILRNLETGETFSGNARSVASYNIVSSQYATLFAERNAQKKAATLLANEIERDLLVRLAEGAASDAVSFDAEIDSETELLPTPGEEPVELIENY